MVKTGTHPRSNWLRTCTLLGAMVMVPWGSADAHGPDYEAIEERLGDAVSAGEISLRQAVVMLDALRSATDAPRQETDATNADHLRAWIESVGKNLKSAIKEGDLSEEDAWHKWHQFKNDELGPKLKAIVRADELSEATARKIWREVEEAEAAERLKSAVAKGEITETEAWVKWHQIKQDHDQEDGKGNRILGHFEGLGISVEMLGRVKQALTDSGIKPEQMEGVLGGMLRVIHKLKLEGEEFELDPKLQEYFTKRLDLTDRQLESVVGLARRLVGVVSERRDEEQPVP